VCGGGGSSFDNRGREHRYGETRWERQSKNRVRERESRGGREEGIRLGDEAAGTGCSAGSRSYCALVLPQGRRRGLLKVFIPLQNPQSSEHPDLFFPLKRESTERKGLVGLSFFLTLLRRNVLILRVSYGGLPEEEHPLSAVSLQEEG